MRGDREAGPGCSLPSSLKDTTSVHTLGPVPHGAPRCPPEPPGCPISHCHTSSPSPGPPVSRLPEHTAVPPRTEAQRQSSPADVTAPVLAAVPSCWLPRAAESRGQDSEAGLCCSRCPVRARVGAGARPPDQPPWPHCPPPPTQGPVPALLRLWGADPGPLPPRHLLSHRPGSTCLGGRESSPSGPSARAWGAHGPRQLQPQRGSQVRDAH